MNEEKLSSDKVPQKFAEWLLSMGCPPDKVPSIDKLAEMCRGQYYMVWRSLMEHVEPKDSIRQKRLQVFHNDIQKCKKKNAFCKPDSSAVVPEELSLWRQQTALREKVEDKESQVLQARETLNLLVDKVSDKLSQRSSRRARLQDAQRRAWLLQRARGELWAKRDNLLEAKAIADSLCGTEDCSDIDSKLDKVTLPRENRAALSVSLAPLASSSVASNHADLNDSDEQLSSVVKCGGSLWPQLCARRAALPAQLAAPPELQAPAAGNRVSPQWVLSHTAAMHCSLALDAVKNRVHTKHTQHRLAASITQLNEYLSGEACELLVVRCERARGGGRVRELRAQHQALLARAGAYGAPGGGAAAAQAHKHIANLDKAIESKRDELKRVITSLAVTERKIQNVRECLVTVFNSFHSDAGHIDMDRFGGQLSLPQESMATLRRFYDERREKHRNKVNLSMDLDTSENCSSDVTENGHPTFIDEIKLYLKKFQLEKNRKLILESGEKVWISESMQFSIERLQGAWHRDNLTCALVCPSVSLPRNIQRLIQLVQKKEQLEAVLANLDTEHRSHPSIDITSEVEEEQKTIDKIKKRLNENILSLQKTAKTLDLGQENLQLWSEDNIKMHISSNRTVDGKTYKEYEGYYIESLTL